MSDAPLSILLIDDDEDEFVVVRDTLDEVGGSRFQLSWASSWEEAVEAIEAGGHDLFLVD